MTASIDAFHQVLSDLHEIDPDRSQVLWGAYRACTLLLSKTEDPFCLSFLQGELDEFIQDVVATVSEDLMEAEDQ